MTCQKLKEMGPFPYSISSLSGLQWKFYKMIKNGKNEEDQLTSK